MPMRKSISALLAALLVISGVTTANADSASPAQSMTHLKTAPGVSAALERSGVIFYAQGGATAGVMGDSISDAKGQVVFHIPITANKDGVQHAGSNIVLFNTANDRQVLLRNPVIDLKKGLVAATIPQAGDKPITILLISNADSLKAKRSTDKAAGVRSRTFAAASMSFAPGVAETLTSLLGLPSGAIAEGSLFATADVTLKKRVR